jgi:hypothetical protein
MKKLFAIFLTLIGLATSCGVSSFIKGEGGWASVLISDRVSYALAWEDVTSILTQKFEIDMISKESGYIRTKWKTNWVAVPGGRPQKDYRVRVTIKMSETRKKIEVNAEAEKKNGDFWIQGYDSQLLETMKKDIAGIVGS